MLRVLIVDDSPTARQLLAEMLSSDPEIEVVGTARNGREGVDKAQELRPDLVTMDVMMPVMDGIAATQEIMTVAPTPIVLVSASTLVPEVDTAMQALRAGALTLLRKPLGPGSPNYDQSARELIDTIKAMAEVKVVGRHHRATRAKAPAAPVLKRPPVTSGIIAIAASTGGPPALAKILSALPSDFPLPILVVQHIAAGFSEGLVAWLNSITRLEVKFGVAGESLAGGRVYIAPEGQHLGVASRQKIQLSTAPPIEGFRPSANFLFNSVAQSFADATIAMILTGMGDDGVAGLAAVHQAGGFIVAQDEASCVVFGMPGAACAAGVVDLVRPLDALPSTLMGLVRSHLA